MTIEQIVEKTLVASQERFDTAAASSGYLELKRGKATIPLPGIDVPFHSRQLLGGKKTHLLCAIFYKNDHLTKSDSGQTWGKHSKRDAFSAGVPAFRKLLTSKFDRAAIAKELDTRLINRYVPVRFENSCDCPLFYIKMMTHVFLP